MNRISVVTTIDVAPKEISPISVVVAIDVISSAYERFVAQEAVNASGLS